MNQTLIRELLAEHKATKQTLKASQDKERKLRDKIVSLIFPQATTGTNKASFKEQGLEVKAVIKDNWTVNQNDIGPLLEEHETLHKAFKYKYDMVMAGYKALTEEERVLLSEAVTCKQAVPELSYEGELGDSYMSKLKANEGLLYIDGELQGALVMDQIATHYGFNFRSELVTFLEEIQ